MRREILICCCALVAASCQAQVASDLKALYDAHQWKVLSDRIQNTKGGSLYCGAVGVTFSQNVGESERLLLSVISSSPHSREAYEASEWLSHLYLYRGQYRSLVSIMEKRWAAFPKKKENSQEQTEIAGLRGLPNQKLKSTQRSKLTHDPGSIFIPLSINGDVATYFFDTGAWICCMSESEAKRLGLKIRNSSGTIGQSAGSRVGFRTAVARNVWVGNTHLRNVSFAVFPDNQEPWSDLPPGCQGIIGMPILVSLRTLRWEREGTIELAGPPQRFETQRSNLTFDNDHLVIAAIIQDKKVSATVDTGAVSTDLYKPFADRFGALLTQYGRKDSTEVRGVGHTGKFDSVTLPELRIHLANTTAVLSPAHVLLKSIGANCCIGNFGMDLFKQAPQMTIDFNAMILQLGSAGGVR